MALDGSNWQHVDFFDFQVDIEVENSNDDNNNNNNSNNNNSNNNNSNNNNNNSNNNNSNNNNSNNNNDIIMFFVYFSSFLVTIAYTPVMLHSPYITLVID